MQPITVSVGGLAASSANNIAASQTPLAGTLLLNGTPSGGANATTFTGTGSISANVLTVSATTTGGMGVGTVLSGAGVAANTVVIGLGPTTGTWIVSPGQTVSSTTIYGNSLVTLDKPRQVLITTTGDEHTKTFTITGTDWTGGAISETITGIGSGTAKASALSYATVSSITISANAAAAITVGTNGVASSPWVRLDGWANPSVSKQAIVSGTVNYTVQYSNDDPNAIQGTPVNPNAMTWFNDMNTEFVAATANQFDLWAFVPLWVRVVLNSGTGTVTMTLQQTGAAPR